jgi:hypothetical protein
MNSIQRSLFGESIREIGVLLLVFVPLDVLVGTKSTELPARAHALIKMGWLSTEHWTVLLFTIAGLALVYYGATIESRAKLEERSALNVVLDDSV